MPNSCQQDTNCELRITLNEDGCTLARNYEEIHVTSPLNGTIINDTSLTLVYETGGSCQFKSDQFHPPTTGVYDFSITYTDYGGLTTSTTGTFSVSPATQAPPPTFNPGTGGGVTIIEEVVIIKQDINYSYQVVPPETTVTLPLGRRYLGEFQVVNDGVLGVTIDITINEELTDANVIDWLRFDGRSSIEGLLISPGQGISSNTKFIRYELASTRAIPKGIYTIVLDVRSGDTLKRHTINVEVVDSIWAQFDSFWNAEIFPLGSVCSTETEDVFNPLTNSTVLVSEVFCVPSYVLRTKHLIYTGLSLVVITFLFVRSRRPRGRRGREEE